MSARMLFSRLVVSGLAVTGGCGGGSSSDAPAGEVEIRYLRWADATELDATRAALSRFEELNPGIRVKLEYTSWNGYASKLQTLMAGRATPDVFALSGAWFHDHRARGALEDLTPYIAADTSISLDDFYAAPREVFAHAGRQYGLPRDFNVIALFYNRTLFDAAGAPYPDSTWTWDTFRAAARNLTRDVDGDGRLDQWGLQVSNDMEVCWGNYVYQNSGRILSDDRTHFRMHEDAAVGALDFLRALIYEDGSSPSPLDMESLSGTPFRNGRLAMITSGSWTLGTLDATEGFSYGVAPLPRGRERAAVANGVAHALASTSDRKDAAWELIAYLSGPEGQRILARSGTSIPARRAVAESPDYLDAGRPDVDRRVFLDAMDHAHTLPFTRDLERWGIEVLRALDRVWLGEEMPADAMSGITTKVEGILARHVEDASR